MADITGAAFFDVAIFGAAPRFGLELDFDLAVFPGLAFGRAALVGAAFLAVFFALVRTGFLAVFFAAFLAGRRVVLPRAGPLRFAGFLAAGAIAV